MRGRSVLQRLASCAPGGWPPRMSLTIPGPRLGRVVFLAAAVWLSATAPATGQTFAVLDLHSPTTPALAIGTQGLGISNDMMVIGRELWPGPVNPSLKWTFDAAQRRYTATLLPPDGEYLGIGRDGYTVGQVTSSRMEAMLWYPRGGVHLLHPKGYVRSAAVGTASGVVVGWGELGGTVRALCFTCSPGGLDLAPGAVESRALGTDGHEHVGWVIDMYAIDPPGLIQHAMSWTEFGHVVSAKDLHPLGKADSSIARATWNGNHVGDAVFQGRSAAVIWTEESLSGGPSYSPVRLPQNGFVASWGKDIGPRGIVGYGQMTATSDDMRAILWRMGPGGYQQIDLHQYLPQGSRSSEAHGTNEDGDVVGSFIHPGDGRWHAVVWHRIRLRQFSITPSTVPPGRGATGTVRLSWPAPAGGIKVRISPAGRFGLRAWATSPEVTIPEGATTGQFAIVSLPQRPGTKVTVTFTAKMDGVGRSAFLVLDGGLK